MEEKKKNNLGLWIIIIILLLAMGTLGWYAGIKMANIEDKKDAKTEEKKEEEKDSFEELKEVTGQDLLEIYSLINLRSDEGYGVFGYYTLEELPNGKISELKKEDKQYIIYNYAVENEMYYRIDGKNEDDYCYAGSGSCIGISRTDYEKIKKLFNITESFDDAYADYEIYKERKDVGDIALYTYGGWVAPYTFKHIKLDARYKDEKTIIFKDTVEIYGDDGENLEKTKLLKKAEIKYTFNKLDDGSYALESIEH